MSEQEVKMFFGLAILLILGGIGVALISNDYFGWGVLFSLLLLLIPWAYRQQKDPSEFKDRVKNFRKHKTRLIVTGIFALPILISLGVTLGMNLKHNIQTHRQEQQRIAEKEAEKERQEAIEEEKRNTPKPEIIIHNKFDEVLSGTKTILDFEVSNATEIYIQDNLISVTELGQYSEEIDLGSPEMTLHIKAKNKYWENEETIEIEREKTEEEIEVVRIMEEERLEAERIAEEKSLLEHRLRNGIGISRTTIEDRYVKNKNAKFERSDIDNKNGKMTTAHIEEDDVLIQNIGPDDNLYSTSISVSANARGALNIIIFATIIDNDLIENNGEYIGNLIEKAKANGGEWEEVKNGRKVSVSIREEFGMLNFGVHANK